MSMASCLVDSFVLFLRLGDYTADSDDDIEILVER